MSDVLTLISAGLLTMLIVATVSDYLERKLKRTSDATEGIKTEPSDDI